MSRNLFFELKNENFQFFNSWQIGAPLWCSSFSSTSTSTLAPTTEEIDCWIGGGQRIYEEAVKHPKAVELQLTIVHKKIYEGKGLHSGVSFFPAKYRYDNKFQEVKELEQSGETAESKSVKYSFHVWRKKGFHKVFKK